MTRTANARADDSGAVKAGELFTAQNPQTDTALQALAGSRFERSVARVHDLGPRPFRVMDCPDGRDWNDKWIEELAG